MDFVFNTARGMAGYYSTLPGDDDALVLVPLLADGLADDDTLMDCDTLAEVLTNATQSPTLDRITLASGVTRTVDYDADWANVDLDDDPTWPAASSDPLAALVICYSPTSSSADADLIPLTKHDFIVEPNGTDLVAQVSASGFYRSY